MTVMVTLTCNYCGSFFERKKQRREDRNRPVYCSRDHYLQYATDHPESAPRAFSVSGPYKGTHVCPTCDSEFNAHHPSVIYCTKLCKTRAQNARTAERYKLRSVVGANFAEKNRKTYKQAMLLDTLNCMICGTQFEQLELKQIHVDHCHRTGTLRGLLCSNCNQGLGNFKDDVERLQRAIEYLNEHKERLT